MNFENFKWNDNELGKLTKSEYVKIEISTDVPKYFPVDRNELFEFVTGDSAVYNEARRKYALDIGVSLDIGGFDLRSLPSPKDNDLAPVGITFASKDKNDTITQLSISPVSVTGYVKAKDVDYIKECITRVEGSTITDIKIEPVYELTNEQYKDLIIKAHCKEVVANLDNNEPFAGENFARNHRLTHINNGSLKTRDNISHFDVDVQAVDTIKLIAKEAQNNLIQQQAAPNKPTNNPANKPAKKHDDMER